MRLIWWSSSRCKTRVQGDWLLEYNGLWFWVMSQSESSRSESVVQFLVGGVSGGRHWGIRGRWRGGLVLAGLPTPVNVVRQPVKHLPVPRLVPVAGHLSLRLGWQVLARRSLQCHLPLTDTSPSDWETPHHDTTWPAVVPRAPHFSHGLCSRRGSRPDSLRGRGRGSCGERPSCPGRWGSAASRTPLSSQRSRQEEQTEDLHENCGACSPWTSHLTTLLSRNHLALHILDLTFHLLLLGGTGGFCSPYLSLSSPQQQSIKAVFVLSKLIPFAEEVKVEINEMQF